MCVFKYERHSEWDCTAAWLNNRYWLKTAVPLKFAWTYSRPVRWHQTHKLFSYMDDLRKKKNRLSSVGRTRRQQELWNLKDPPWKAPLVYILVNWPLFPTETSNLAVWHFRLEKVSSNSMPHFFGTANLFPHNDVKSSINHDLVKMSLRDCLRSSATVRVFIPPPVWVY